MIPAKVKEKYSHPLSLLEIVEGEPGNPLSFNVNVSPEFVEWFKRDQCLKRWSEPRFQKWFKGFLDEAMREVVIHQPIPQDHRYVDPFGIPEKF